MSTRPCSPLITKAENLLGAELREINKYSKVYEVADMQRVIDEIDRDSQPASRDDVTTLSAMFLAKASIKKPDRGSPDESDFVIYVLGLAEAFSEFPSSIGWEAIHGGKGILSKLEFRPKPVDITKFCSALMLKRSTARVMALRHIAESKRRADERQAPAIDWEQRKRRAEEIIKGSRAQSMEQA